MLQINYEPKDPGYILRYAYPAQDDVKQYSEEFLNSKYAKDIQLEHFIDDLLMMYGVEIGAFEEELKRMDTQK